MFQCKCGRSPSVLVCEMTGKPAVWLCPCGKGYVDSDGSARRAHVLASAIERYARAHFEEILPKIVRDVLEAMPYD